MGKRPSWEHTRELGTEAIEPGTQSDSASWEPEMTELGTENCFELGTRLGELGTQSVLVFRLPPLPPSSLNSRTRAFDDQAGAGVLAAWGGGG